MQSRVRDTRKGKWQHKEVQGVLTLSWQGTAARHPQERPPPSSSFISSGYKEQLGPGAALWSRAVDGAHCSPCALPSHPFPSLCGSSFINCGLSFGSGVKLEVLADFSCLQISKRTPLQVWDPHWKPATAYKAWVLRPKNS